MSESYFQVLLRGVTSSEEELVTELCFSFGAAGVSEDLQFQQNHKTYETETLHTSTHDLIVYFESKPGEDFLLSLQSRFPDVQIKVSEEENKDWLEEWKKGYEAFPLVHDIWVVPSWKTPPPEAKKVIHIDPGMAFGTGTHATTQIASELLSKIDFTTPKTMIDVGTGTGILAILASIFGAQDVVATEIDDMAREVAKDNCQLNKASQVNVIDYQIESVTDSFDIVVANIIDGVLLKLKDDLKRVLKPQGILILTGILEEREREFAEQFGFEDNFEVNHRISKEEWVGFSLKGL